MVVAAMISENYTRPEQQGQDTKLVFQLPQHISTGIYQQQKLVAATVLRS